MANLSPYAAAQMFNWLTGGRAVVCCRPTSARPTGGPAQRPSFVFQATLLHFRYRNPKKRNPLLQVFCYKY
jgi:hypothetical protein